MGKQIRWDEQGVPIRKTETSISAVLKLPVCVLKRKRICSATMFKRESFLSGNHAHLPRMWLSKDKAALVQWNWFCNLNRLKFSEIDQPWPHCKIKAWTTLTSCSPLKQNIIPKFGHRLIWKVPILVARPLDIPNNSILLLCLIFPF